MFISTSYIKFHATKKILAQKSFGKYYQHLINITKFIKNLFFIFEKLV